MQTALTDVITYSETHPSTVPEQLVWDLKARTLVLLASQLGL